jgi:phosphoribosyl-AMP cyclohydrolase
MCCREAIMHPRGDHAPAMRETVPVPRVTDSQLDRAVAARLTRDRDGLVCAVVQERGTSAVLMVGWMDDEALHRTLTTGRVTFWSRSRAQYWRKGDTSGNVQHVKAVAVDCDGDAVLVTVDQVGAACHTGARTCFDAGALEVTESLVVTESLEPSESTDGPVAADAAPEGTPA